MDPHLRGDDGPNCIYVIPAQVGIQWGHKIQWGHNQKDDAQARHPRAGGDPIVTHLNYGMSMAWLTFWGAWRLLVKTVNYVNIDIIIFIQANRASIRLLFFAAQVNSW